MKTSQYFAAAATHLGRLLGDGQRTLITAGPDEARIAAQARDQVAAAMGAAARDVSVRLGTIGDRRAAHWCSRLAVELDERRTGLHGPSPSDLALRPPTAPAARAWVLAADALGAASTQAQRAAQGTREPLRGAAADIAALTSALAFADEDLARALRWLDRTDLDAASDRLSTHRLSWTRRIALASLQDLDKAAADEYHLTPPVTGVTPVTSPALAPAGLDRATTLLLDDVTLTASQHRVLAVASARIAHDISRVARTRADHDQAGLGPGGADSLEKFAQSNLNLADAWGRASHLWCSRPGSTDGPAQVHAVADTLRRNPDGLLTGQALEVAQRLPAIPAISATILARSLNSEHWMAASYDAHSARQWDVIAPDYDAPPWQVAARLDGDIPIRSYRFGQDPDGEVGSPHGVQELRRIQTAQQNTIAAGAAVRDIVGPPDRAEPAVAASPAEVRSARTILRENPAPIFHRHEAPPTTQPAPRGLGL